MDWWQTNRTQDQALQNLVDLVAVDKNVFLMPGIYHEAPQYWERIWEALNTAAIGDPDQTGIGPASIDKMSEEEAQELAQDIVSLESMLDSFAEDWIRKTK